jgi:hypothetical protein
MISTKFLCNGSINLTRPFVWTLSLARRTFLFVDLSLTDVVQTTEAFHLVSDAARRADNIGTDEIPTVKLFSEILIYAEDVIAATGKDGGRGAMVGLLAVLPCHYVRSCHPINGAIFMVNGESIASRLVSSGEISRGSGAKSALEVDVATAGSRSMSSSRAACELEAGGCVT